MKEVINHQNIGTLMNLTETISKLDDFLSHIKNNLEKEFPNVKTIKQLNVKDKEYIIVQRTGGLTIKVGFNWLYNDVYFGIRVYIEKVNDVLKLTEKLKKYQWGYEKEEQCFVISHERQLLEQLFTNDQPENEWSAITNLFSSRIKECKIITEELK